MSQVSAVIQAHTHDRVAQLAKGLVDSIIGLGAGVRLNIGKLGAEQLLGPLDGDIFHHVHALTAAVIPFAGIAFGILVGKNSAGRRQNSGADDVLRGDQLDVLLLAVILRPDSLTHFRVLRDEKIHRLLDHV